MRASLSLIHKEFSSYFFSPIAYVMLAVITLVTGFLFSQTLLLLTASGPQGIEFPMQTLLGLGDLQSRPGVLSFLLFWVVFLIVPPLLTMRLLAEERNTGTLEMLLTAPLRDWQIVLCKYVACFLFYLVLWLPTLIYLPILLDFSWNPLRAGIDPLPVVTTYVGLALAGAMLLAIGLLVSSLVKSPLLAVLIGLFLNLVLIMADFLRLILNMTGILQSDMGTGSQLFLFFTIPLHFERNFTRGLLDTRQLILYSSVALVCLFVTIRSLESRRWR